MKGPRKDKRVEYRREKVAALVLRGLTQRRIVEVLPLAPMNIVDERGRPFTKSTIDRDIQAIRKEWREHRLADMDEHIARELAVHEDIYAEARAKGDLHAAMKARNAIRHLLGLDAPTRGEISGPQGGPIELESEGGSAIISSLLRLTKQRDADKA